MSCTLRRDLPSQVRGLNYSSALLDYQLDPLITGTGHMANSCFPLTLSASTYPPTCLVLEEKGGGGAGKKSDVCAKSHYDRSANLPRLMKATLPHLTKGSGDQAGLAETKETVWSGQQNRGKELLHWYVSNLAPGQLSARTVKDACTCVQWLPVMARSCGLKYIICKDASPTIYSGGPTENGEKEQWQEKHVPFLFRQR